MTERTERRLADFRAGEAELERIRQQNATRDLDNALAVSSQMTEALQRQADAKGQAVKELADASVDAVKSLASTSASLLDQFVQDVAQGNSDAVASLARTRCAP